MAAASCAVILATLVPIIGEQIDIRILVALEDDYRAYREMIAAGLRILRPSTEVESTTLEALEEELERFDPQVVICSGHEDVESSDRLAWIELSMDPTQPTKIRVGGCYLERTNPSVEQLLKVIDEVGNSSILVRAGLIHRSV